MILFYGGQAVPPATAYANNGGKGNRTSLITVSTNITPDGSSPGSVLVDGVETFGTGSAWDMPGTGSTAIPDGAYVKYYFNGVSVYIDEATLLFPYGTPSMGAWVFEISNDDSSYNTVASWNWDAQPKVVPFTGVTPFKYLRQRKNGAGAFYTNNWWTEIWFKIAVGL